MADGERSGLKVRGHFLECGEGGREKRLGLPLGGAVPLGKPEQEEIEHAVAERLPAESWSRSGKAKALHAECRDIRR